MVMIVPRPEGPHPLENYPEPPPSGEDLPYSDGEPMESERHVRQAGLLIQSLNYAWRDRSDFYCNGNMFVYFSKAQAKHNDFRGPDVFIVLGTERRERRSWVVWEEDGKLPAVVIELLSPSTDAVDRGKKKELYAKILRVPVYVLYDPWTFALEAYELDPNTLEYVRIAPDSRGFVWCEPLRLWLGVSESRFDYGLRLLRWFDEAGEPLPIGSEDAVREAHRADEAARRADEATKALAEARARVAALKARLAELEKKG